MPSRSASRSTYLPLLAVLFTVLAWSSAFVVIRAVGADFSPGAMAFGRLLVGSILLVVVAAIRRVSIPNGRALVLVIAYGALWFALYTVVVNAAEQHLDAGTTALLVNIGPIVVAVLAGLFLGEGFPPQLLVGLAVSFLGAAAIAFGSATGPRADLFGVWLAVAAALLYAIGMTVQKLALREIEPLAATVVGCVVGAAVTAPYAGDLIAQVAAGPTGSTVGVIYLGAVPTALAFLTWAYALKYTNAGVLASSSYLIPVVSIAMSAIFLGEVPTALGYAGGVLCLAGVVVARWQRRSPAVVPADRPRQPAGRAV